MIGSGIDGLGIKAGTDGLKLNRFGASDWKTAAMIASGGLSGGISASISGGEFWEGARQGLTVSILNHTGQKLGLYGNDGFCEGDECDEMTLAERKKASLGSASSKSSHTLNDLRKLAGEKVADTRQWIFDNSDSILDVSDLMQDVGDGMAVAGYALTLTVVGAEIGVPLATIGNGISTAGSAIEMSVHLNAADLNGFANEAGYVAVGELAAFAMKKIPGVNSALAKQILKQNAGLKVIMVERIIKTNPNNGNSNFSNPRTP